jgi:invasion protein IalB
MDRLVLQRARNGVLQLLVILCTAGVAEMARAQEPQGSQHQVHGDWVVRCVSRKDAPPCDMVQVLTHKETRRPIMVFSIGHAGQQEQFGVRIGVPLGVLVSGGAVVRIDDKEELRDFKFTRCLATECQIEALLEPDKLQSFRQGERGFLAILNAEGKPLILPLSLKGFTIAMEEVATRNRSWAKDHGK